MAGENPAGYVKPPEKRESLARLDHDLRRDRAAGGHAVPADRDPAALAVLAMRVDGGELHADVGAPVIYELHCGP